MFAELCLFVFVYIWAVLFGTFVFCLREGLLFRLCFELVWFGFYVLDGSFASLWMDFGGCWCFCLGYFRLFYGAVRVGFAFFRVNVF